MKFNRTFSSESKSEAGGGLYLKLKDKDTVKGVFMGDLYEFDRHWVGGKSVLCEMPGCSFCSSGEKKSFGFRINFVTKENSAYTAKIFEQGQNVYQQLQALAASGYDLEKNIMSITRHGSGKSDTYYLIVPVPNGALPEAQAKMLSQVKLHDLRQKPKTQAYLSNKPEETFGEELPF